MGNIWHDVGADRIRPNDFISVIEIEKGAKTSMSSTKRPAI